MSQHSTAHHSQQVSVIGRPSTARTRSSPLRQHPVPGLNPASLPALLLADATLPPCHQPPMVVPSATPPCNTAQWQQCTTLGPSHWQAPARVVETASIQELPTEPAHRLVQTCQPAGITAGWHHPANSQHRALPPLHPAAKHDAITSLRLTWCWPLWGFARVVGVVAGGTRASTYDIHKRRHGSYLVWLHA